MLCLFSVFVLTVLRATVASQALDECPEYNGHEEFRQFLKFYEYRAGADAIDADLAPEDIMTLVANDNLDNPRWVQPNDPYEHDLESGITLLHANI